MTELQWPEWKDIYEKWKIGMMYYPANADRIEVEAVHIDLGHREYKFYGYDWLLKAGAEQRKQLIRERLSEFLYFTQPTNKGTIQTVGMLAEAESAEERAAIWIAATAFELNGDGWSSEIRRQAFLLHRAAISFLNKRFDVWHHAMRKLVPKIMVSPLLIEHLRQCDTETMIGIIQTNMIMLQGSYTPLYYSSMDQDKKPEH